MSFFGRLGSEELKYRVDLIVLRVDTTSSSDPLAVRFIRGNKSSVTPPIAARSGTYDFGGRTLSTSATLYRKRDKWLPKEAEISVVSCKGSERPFGRVLLDLSRYVEMGEKSTTEEWQLERCADRRAKISVRLVTKWLKGAATGGGEDDEVSGKGATAALGSMLDEADNSQAHNLDDFLQHDDGDAAEQQEEEQEQEEEEEEGEPAVQPVRRQQQRRGGPGVDSLQLPPKGRREERKEAPPQRGRQQPQQTLQREGSRQRMPEPEEDAEEEQQEEEAEADVDGGEQQEEEEERRVQIRPARLNGRPATVITTQQTQRTVVQSAPMRGKPAAAQLPPARRLTVNDEDDAGSEVKEESATGSIAASEEEIIEDDDEPHEEEEEDYDGRTVKFGGVEARGSTTKSRSPHHTLVQPMKSNLKGGAVLLSSTVPSQATTIRDNITISSATGSAVSPIKTARSQPTAVSATSIPPSSSPSLSASSLSSDSSVPSSPLPTRGSDSSSVANSPKHAAIAAELRGVRAITPSHIFSCTLAEAMTLNPRTSSLDVPFVFDRLIVACESSAGGGLAAEGIFRVAADKRAVDALKSHLQEGNYKIESSVESVVVAAVLKAWLMATATKQPLIPPQLHAQCLAIGQLDVDKQRAQHRSDSEEEDEAVIARPSRPRQMLLQLVPSLPFLTKRLLVRLIALILKTANPPLSTRNRMNVHALAVVFAPSVLTLQPEAGVDGYEMFQRAKYAVRFLEHLVQHSDVLERESGLGAGDQSPVKAIRPAAASLSSASTTLSSAAAATSAGGVVVGTMTPVVVQPVATGDERPVVFVDKALTSGSVVAASPRTIRAVAAGRGSVSGSAIAAPNIAPATSTVTANRTSPASSLSSNSSSTSAPNVVAVSGRLPSGAVPVMLPQPQRGKAAAAAAPSAIDKALQMAGTEQGRRQSQQREMARQRPGQRTQQQQEEEEEEVVGEDEEEAEVDEEQLEDEDVEEPEDSDVEEAQQPVVQRAASMLRGKPASAAQPAAAGNVVQASPRTIRAAVDQMGAAIVTGSATSRQTAPGRPPQPAARAPVQQPLEDEEEQGGNEFGDEQSEERAEDEQQSEEDADEQQSPQLHKHLSSPPNRQSSLTSKPAASRVQQPPPPPPAAKQGPPPPVNRMRPSAPSAPSAPSPASHLIAANLNGITTVPAADRRVAPPNSRATPQQSGVYGNQRGRNVFNDEAEQDEHEEHDSRVEEEEEEEQHDEERLESAPRRPSPLPIADSDDEDSVTPPVIHMDEQQSAQQQRPAPLVKQTSIAPPGGSVVQASPRTVRAAGIKADAAVGVAQEEKQLLQQSSQLLVQQQKVMEQHTKLQQQQQQLFDYEAKVAEYERRLKEQAESEARRSQEEEQRRKKEAEDKEKSGDKLAQEAAREREIERLKSAKALQAAQNEAASAKKENETLQSTLNKRNAELIELKGKAKAAASEPATASNTLALADKLKAKDRQVEELTAKLSAQTAAIASLHVEKRARDEQEEKRLQEVAGVDALEMRVSAQDKQLQQQAERVQQLQVELRAKDAEISRLSVALTAAEAKAAAAIAAAGHDAEHVEEAEDDSEYEVYDDDSDETVELKQRVAKLKRLMRRKNQQVVQLKKLTGSTTSPLASIASTPAASPRPAAPQADTSELQRMLRSSEAKVAAREKEVAEWKEKLEVAGRQRADAVREVSDLKDELKKRELHVSELVAQVKQLTTDKQAESGQKATGKGKDGKEVSRLLEERAVMEGQLIAMQQQIDAKQTVIDEYERRLSELQTSLASMEHEAEKVRLINLDIEQKMEQLQHNTEQLHAVTEERDQLQQRLKAAESELSASDAEPKSKSSQSSPSSSAPSTPTKLSGHPPPSAGSVISSVTAQRELSKTKEALERLKLKYESSRVDWQSKVEAEQHRSTMTQLQINTLQQENDILRQRQIGLEELRDRLTTAATTPGSATYGTPRKRDKAREATLQAQLLAAQEECRYLEKQVRDCESILALARETWAMTAAAREEDCQRLEAELAAQRERYEAVVEDKGVEYVQLEVLSKRLSKSERAREALRRQVSEMEEEQARWRKRLDEAQRQLREREEECQLLKAEVVREGIALKEIAQDHWETKEWLRLNAKK